MQTLKASVSTGEKRSEFFEVKVVNCDTITQVKEKVIEVYYRDRPYSECPKPDRMQLGKVLRNWEAKSRTVSAGFANCILVQNCLSEDKGI